MHISVAEKLPLTTSESLPFLIYCGIFAPERCLSATNENLFFSCFWIRHMHISPVEKLPSRPVAPSEKNTFIQSSILVLFFTDSAHAHLGSREVAAHDQWLPLADPVQDVSVRDVHHPT